MADDIWTQFYSYRAADYTSLISHEDYQGNILKSIAGLLPLAGSRVAEFGAGTGRLTRLLTPHVRQVAAFDRAVAMLREAQSLNQAARISNASLALGDNRQLPAAANWADLAIEGWSFLHLKVWHPETWINEVQQAIEEMQRVVSPGGRLLLIETLGTGHKEPHIPASFQPFFLYLEKELGFQRSWTRTDFRFESPEQAQVGLGEAFGEALEKLEWTPQGWILPECTGFWFRDKE